MQSNSRTISTENGRDLQIVETGQLDGIPVIALHGTPGSRLIYSPWAEDAQERGIRLIGYDRSGYGGSTPNPGRSVASVADDIAAIAKNMGIDRLSVWGISGGGPHALACAALLPDLVVAAAALASPAPYPADGLDWYAGMGQDNIDEFGAALDSRKALVAYIEGKTPAMLNADPKMVVQALASLLCLADVAVFTEEFAKTVLKKTREGIEKKRDGWIDDDIAFVTPWGFELSQIQTPLLLMHGKQDQMVPFSHAEWLASQIPNAETRFLAEDGHLTLSANRIPEVHAWLLSKMH